MRGLLKYILQFYWDGFRSMTLGRSLWKIVFIKLFIIFVVIRVFFCPDYLESRYNTDRERADHVFAAISTPAAVKTGQEVDVK